MCSASVTARLRSVCCRCPPVAILDRRRQSCRGHPDDEVFRHCSTIPSPGNDVMYAREPLGAHAIAIAMEAAGGGCSLKDTRCPEAIIVTAVMAVAGMVSGVTK